MGPKEAVYDGNGARFRRIVRVTKFDGANNPIEGNVLINGERVEVGKWHGRWFFVDALEVIKILDFASDLKQQMFQQRMRDAVSNKEDLKRQWTEGPSEE